MTDEFREQLRCAINGCSRENESNTPDFILATFLGRVLEAWDEAVQARADWYGSMDEPGQETKP